MHLDRPSLLSDDDGEWRRPKPGRKKHRDEQDPVHLTNRRANDKTTHFNFASKTSIIRKAVSRFDSDKTGSSGDFVRLPESLDRVI